MDEGVLLFFSDQMLLAQHDLLVSVKSIVL